MSPNICGLRHQIGRLSGGVKSHARSFLQVDPESPALGPTCPLLAEATPLRRYYRPLGAEPCVRRRFDPGGPAG